MLCAILNGKYETSLTLSNLKKFKKKGTFVERCAYKIHFTEEEEKNGFTFIK